MGITFVGLGAIALGVLFLVLLVIGLGSFRRKR